MGELQCHILICRGIASAARLGSHNEVWLIGDISLWCIIMDGSKHIGIVCCRRERRIAFCAMWRIGMERHELIVHRPFGIAVVSHKPFRVCASCSLLIIKKNSIIWGRRWIEGSYTKGRVVAQGTLLAATRNHYPLLLHIIEQDSASCYRLILLVPDMNTLLHHWMKIEKLGKVSFHAQWCALACLRYSSRDGTLFGNSRASIPFLPNVCIKGNLVCREIGIRWDALTLRACQESEGTYCQQASCILIFPNILLHVAS